MTIGSVCCLDGNTLEATALKISLASPWKRFGSPLHFSRDTRLQTFAKLILAWGVSLYFVSRSVWFKFSDMEGSRCVNYSIYSPPLRYGVLPLRHTSWLRSTDRIFQLPPIILKEGTPSWLTSSRPVRWKLAQVCTEENDYPHFINSSLVCPE